MNRQSSELPEDQSSSDERQNGAMWNVKILSATARLVNGESDFVKLIEPVSATGAGSHPKLLLPGSFNPLHRGHVAMANLATDRLGVPAWFEMSIENADKPPLSNDQACQRLLGGLVGAGLESNSEPRKKTDEVPQNLVWTFRPHGLLVTRLATFVAKARQFPNAIFAIGADTIVRVADPRFYSGSESQRDLAISELVDLNCRFLVFGRSLDGQFHVLDQLRLPERLKAICEQVSQADFREAVSSSHLRQQ